MRLDITTTRYVREVVVGRGVIEYVGDVTCTYDLKTCPGSSGCEVTSFIMDVEKPLISHSATLKGQEEGLVSEWGKTTYFLKKV